MGGKKPNQRVARHKREKTEWTKAERSDNNTRKTCGGQGGSKAKSKARQGGASPPTESEQSGAAEARSGKHQQAERSERRRGSGCVSAAVGFANQDNQMNQSEAAALTGAQNSVKTVV